MKRDGKGHLRLVHNVSLPPYEAEPLVPGRKKRYVECQECKAISNDWAADLWMQLLIPTLNEIPKYFYFCSVSCIRTYYG